MTQMLLIESEFSEFTLGPVPSPDISVSLLFLFYEKKKRKKILVPGGGMNPVIQPFVCPNTCCLAWIPFTGLKSKFLL